MSTRARPCCWAGWRLLRCLREQAISRTLHRYGNVVRPFDEHGVASGSGARPATAPPEGEELLDGTDDRWLAAVERGA